LRDAIAQSNKLARHTRACGGVERPSLGVARSVHAACDEDERSNDHRSDDGATSHRGLMVMGVVMID
jgi:hypothetical protein